MNDILKKHTALRIMTISLGAGIMALNVGVAFVIGQIIDSIGKGDLQKLSMIGLYSLMLMAAYFICGSLYSACSSKYEYMCMTNSKERVLQHLMKNPIYRFQERDVSYYFNLLTKDMDQILDHFFIISYDTPVYTLGLIISLGALLWIDYRMAILFILVMALVMVVPRFFIGAQTKAAEGFSSRYEEFLKELETTLAGFESVKLLNIANSITNKLLGKDREMEEARRNMSVVNGISTYGITSASFFSQVGCMFIGAVFAIKGQITTGQLLMAVQLLNFVFPPIQTIARNNNLLTANKVLRDKVSELLAQDEIHGEDYSPGDIMLKDFGIQIGAKQILNDLNFVFKPGKSYAVIGSSGSGKSTMAKSLAGYYSEYTGSLTYGETEQRDLHPDELSKYVRYIGANTFVLNDTIKENIRMYRDIPEKQIIEVARLVGFDAAFIDKESLGHSGKYISSGEYQRVAIARALVDHPFVLILDEPTANLDPVNAKSIQKLIRELQVPIKIVITHDHNREFLDTFDQVIDLTHKSIGDV
ncbi:MAG: ABC transporter ATP-binding protein [Tissierellia bacterium]|nr:ABC transporter ATP-binding protein [Tissierellia bacterium]